MTTMEKFQNKYRIPSARAPFWDYRWSADYFVTICTYNHFSCFGEIKKGEMILSEIGKIVQSEWLKTFEMRPDMNLYMGEFVIMPNHFHAIIGIGENQYNKGQDLNDDREVVIERDAVIKRNVVLERDAKHCVSTAGTPPTNYTKNRFGPQSKNLSSIIRGFKTGVTKNARIIDKSFAWQTRFHDHIIRDDKSFKNILEYIIENPLNWEKDEFYAE